MTLTVRMRRILRGFSAAFLIIVLLVSCRRPPDESVQTVPPAVSSPVPVRVYAEVTDEPLRVRSAPFLDAEIVGRLMTGDRVLIESRTVWEQTISDRESAWFFIRADGFSGWTFGGFLNIDTDDITQVPADPGVPEPEGLRAPQKALTEKPVAVEADSLPELLLPVSGRESSVRIVNPDEGTISYDPVHETLILPFSNRPDSRLAPYVRGDSGEDLLIVAESRKSGGFRRRYSSGELRILDEPGAPAALLVPFFRLATLENDVWEVYAFLGEDDWPVSVGKLEIAAGEVSIVPVRNPDPLRHSPRSRYTRGQTVYLFGNYGSGSRDIQIALYHDTGEYREGRMLVRPVLAYQLKTTPSGRWNLDFPLDERVPAGRCWAAVGSPVESLDNLYLFVTWIDL